MPWCTPGRTADLNGGSWITQHTLWKWSRLACADIWCFTSGQRSQRSSVHMFVVLVVCLNILWPLDLRRFCRQIRAFVTDTGARRRLRTCRRWCLRKFVRHIGCSEGINLDPPKLFPSDMHTPGWRRHFWPLLTMRGLQHFDFCFALSRSPWAIINFFADDTSKVATDLRSRNFDALAGLMDSVRLLRFASWRWAALDTCIETSARFVLSWSVVFDPETHGRT